MYVAGLYRWLHITASALCVRRETRYDLEEATSGGQPRGDPLHRGAAGPVGTEDLPECEPTTHRGARRVTTTVNASWRRGSTGTATCLVEKCRLLGHPPGSGELATGTWVDPPSAADRTFPAGIPGKTIPHLASPQSLLRHGNGSAGRNLHARRCVASATNLHDALSVRRDRNFTMRCRKKLYDALSVRTRERPRPSARGCRGTASRWPFLHEDRVAVLGREDLAQAEIEVEGLLSMEAKDLVPESGCGQVGHERPPCSLNVS